MEEAFSLDGEPGLSHLRPLTPAKVAQIAARLGESIAPWVKRLLERPWLRPEGTNRHYRWMVALARDAIRLRGRTRGWRLYEEWLDSIRANSPELSLPSQKTKDPRNVLDHARRRAWEFACKKPNCLGARLSYRCAKAHRVAWFASATRLSRLSARRGYARLVLELTTSDSPC